MMSAKEDWGLPSQFLCRLVAHRLQVVEGLDATLIIDHKLVPPPWTRQNLNAQPETSITEIVFNKIPVPDDSTPWEKILEFREDPETKGFLQGLRVWMADFPMDKMSPSEASEKLDWLLFQRTQHLAAHRISHNVTTFGAMFVSAAEIMENFVKIKWGDAAKGIVSLAQRKASLMKMELESPNKELTYLMRAQQAFKARG
jgi:hypothetical protein